MTGTTPTSSEINADLQRRPTDSPEVAERLATAAPTVARNVAAIQERSKARLPRMNALARDVTSRPLPPPVKYARLWKIADELSAARAGHEACRKHCNHCCHIPVPLTRSEARLIGSRIGRSPAQISATQELPSVQPGYHNPCPFLTQGACSIYSHRPLVCRNHSNLDRDDLLCRLTDAPVSVPYFRCESITDLELHIAAEAGEVEVADIRHWFPAQQQ